MHLNKNLHVSEIRGNVGTRIKKVIDGSFDARNFSRSRSKKIKY